jgi:hypothetical protein
LPDSPLLSSWTGFWYCDLLLADIEFAALQRLVVPDGDRPGDLSALIEACSAVEDRAKRTIKIAAHENHLVDIGLDQLTLARAALYKAILLGELPTGGESLRDAVGYLRRGGQQQHVPRALLTHSLFHATTGNFDDARENLDEAFEIAERGPMRLHLADIHLRRPRLFGLMGDRPEKYPWVSPRDDLDKAKKLINECGYGRRREELADAEAAWTRVYGDDATP